MRLLASVKQLGKKKPVIGERELQVPEVSSLRELITAIVRGEVAACSARAADSAEGDAETPVTLLAALSKDEIEDKASAGKVGFGLKYNAKRQNEEDAVENALLSFEDGLYRVFVNDEETQSLNVPLSLKDGDKLTIVRLVMLAGRLW
ncbi:MAG: hypothetical protein LBC93_08700 [Synergistaceae bacterium]|jgi:hypothetical protein|nr:hypothetical protein [Synergistaceae bacterium]